MGNGVHVGVDLVDIVRFKRWQEKGIARLQRVISYEELRYCFAEPSKTAERLAVRYALREAAYKAFAPLGKHEVIPLLAVFKAITTRVSGRGIEMIVVWDTLAQWYDYEKICAISVSVSHTASMAMATVIVCIRD